MRVPKALSGVMLKIIRRVMRDDWIAGNEKVAKALLNLLARTPEDPVSAVELVNEVFEPIADQLPYVLRLLHMSMWSPRLGFMILNLGEHAMAERFVVLGDSDDLLSKIRKLTRKGFGVNIDYLCEDVLSDRESARVMQAYLRLADFLIAHEYVPSISLKLSSFCAHLYPPAPAGSIETIIKNITPVIKKIAAHGGRVYLDAERFELYEIYWETVKVLYAQFGDTMRPRPVLQAYLRDAERTLNRLAKFLEKGSSFRLVCGAYWLLECIEAKRANWELPPVFTEKENTDHSYLSLFERAREYGLDPICATHNLARIVEVVSMCQKRRWRAPQFQMLYGMADQTADALIKKGYDLERYIGVALPGSDPRSTNPFVVRRLFEAGDPIGFLAQHMGKGNAETAELLRKLPYRKEVDNGAE